MKAKSPAREHYERANHEFDESHEWELTASNTASFYIKDIHFYVLLCLEIRGIRLIRGYKKSDFRARCHSLAQALSQPRSYCLLSIT